MKAEDIEYFVRYCREHTGDYSDYLLRDQLVEEYSWAIPNLNALNKLAEYGPIVEIGAGTGYWAMLLRKMDVTVEAFDLYVPGVTDNPFRHKRTWTEVKEGGPEKAAEFPGHTLFLCWPPYENPMAMDALTAYQGQHLIYIGEGQGGCTGDDTFHHELDSEWELVDQVELRRWKCMHDRMRIYRRYQRQ